MSGALHKDPAVVAMGVAALEELNDACRSLVCATIVTDDGFEVAGLATPENGRMGSMASSMQALGDAVALELEIGESQYIVIATDLGHVIQLRIPGQQLVLSAQFGLSEMLGKALAASRQSASNLAKLVSRGDK